MQEYWQTVRSSVKPIMPTSSIIKPCLSACKFAAAFSPVMYVSTIFELKYGVVRYSALQASESTSAAMYIFLYPFRLCHSHCI